MCEMVSDCGWYLQVSMTDVAEHFTNIPFGEASVYEFCLPSLLSSYFKVMNVLQEDAKQ